MSRFDNRLRFPGTAISPQILFLALLSLTANGLSAAVPKLYLQSWVPPVFVTFTDPQNLTGPPDGSFGGSQWTYTEGMYRAVYDLGRVITSDRLEVVHKGLGTLHFAVGPTAAALQTPYGTPVQYWGNAIVAQPGQTADEVRTTTVLSANGLQTFQFLAVYLFNPWYPNFGAGVWVDSVAVVVTRDAARADALATAATIEQLNLSLFNGPNENANSGRRTSLANRAQDAAQCLAVNDIQCAIGYLKSLLEKVDDISTPPDWMNDCPQKQALASKVSQLLTWLLMLSSS